MTENALITKADMFFSDIGGVNGQQFSLRLDLKTTYGGVSVSFNPMRLPQLLQQLGLEKFSELEGTYIQIMDTGFGEECKGIKSIMAKNDEEWFKTENGIYFGCEFFKGYDDLKDKDNADTCAEYLNQMEETIHTLMKENNNIKETIRTAYENERTDMGKIVLKPLMEVI